MEIESHLFRSFLCFRFLFRFLFRLPISHFPFPISPISHSSPFLTLDLSHSRATGLSLLYSLLLLNIPLRKGKRADLKSLPFPLFPSFLNCSVGCVVIFHLYILTFARRHRRTKISPPTITSKSGNISYTTTTRANLRHIATDREEAPCSTAQLEGLPTCCAKGRI